MQFAEWKQQAHDYLRPYIEHAVLSDDSIYGRIVVCSLLPIITARKFDNYTNTLLEETLGANGGIKLLSALDSWLNQTNEQRVADMHQKITDPEWRELFDDLLDKLDVLQRIDILASETGKGWILDSLAKEFKSIESRLIVGHDLIQVGNITNSNGIAIGTHITQIINYYSQSESTIDKIALADQVQSYLQWVKRRYGKVILRNTQRQSLNDLDVEIAQIYEPLKAKPFAQSIAQEEISLQNLFLEQKNFFDPIDTEKIGGIKRGLCRVIVGGPGSGKTTVLQYTAWLFATALLEDNPSLVSEKLNFERELLPIPVIVPLSVCMELVKSESTKNGYRALFKVITEYVAKQLEGSKQSSQYFFNHLLKNGRHLIFLLDGIDEISSKEDRHYIRDEITNLSRERPDLHFVVTCRTATFGRDISFGDDFRAYEIQPLNYTTRRNLIRKRLHASSSKISKVQRKPDDDEAVEAILSVISPQEFRNSAQRHNLFDTPLMVHLILLVYTEKQYLSRHRAELYTLATEYFLQQDYGLPDAKLGSYRDKNADTGYIYEGLMTQLIAWTLHNQRITYATRKLLQDELYKRYSEPKERVKQYLAQIKERGTLLQENGGRYEFSHFAFQEFMVARYLADVELDEKDIADIVTWLCDNGAVTDNWWREPILLIIGYLTINEPELAKEFFEELIAANSSDEENRAAIQLSLAELAIAACDEWFFDDLEYYQSITSQPITHLLELGSLHQRIVAWRALGHVGDPRKGVLAEAHLPQISWSDPIPPGIFQMGDWNAVTGGEQFECQLIDESFCISRYPITVAQFQLFVADGGYTEKGYWTDQGWLWREEEQITQPETYPNAEQRSNCPQIGISWFEAVAYCNWLSRQLGKDIRLPSEYEWERAARHIDGRQYAWGDEWDESKCNSSETGMKIIVPVGLFPSGIAKCGAYDMNGNIKEWCSTKLLDDYKNYEVLVDDDLEGEFDRVFRGGDFDSDKTSVWSAFRDGGGPRERNERTGFRIAIDYNEIEQS